MGEGEPGAIQQAGARTPAPGLEPNADLTATLDAGPDAKVFSNESSGVFVQFDQQVNVTYDVHKDAAATVTCTLRALDKSKGTVGTADVVIGPTRSDVTRRTDPVRTSALAVTGIVRTCEMGSTPAP